MIDLTYPKYRYSKVMELIKEHKKSIKAKKARECRLFNLAYFAD